MTKALPAGILFAALTLGCDNDPLSPLNDPRVDIAADSLTLNLFASAPIGAVTLNAVGGLQFVSRDEKVATVGDGGAVTGVSVGSTYVVAALTGHPDVRDSIRVRVYSDSCGGARPHFGVASPEELALFGYDANAPLNFQKTAMSTTNGVERSSITYLSPDGGSVTGFMWDPVARSGLRPGLIVMHGHPSNANAMSAIAQSYAQYGAVVIAIDAPFARRPGGAMMILPQDSAEQVQVIKDLQRAVDVLRAQPNVDDDRIGYAGFSWGGATGALFVGVERRLKAAALVVGHPGQVSHGTGPGGFKNLLPYTCARRVTWIRAMTPVEPIRYVAYSNVPLLLQNGNMDTLIPSYEAEELHIAAPQPKTVLWYGAGHNLNQQAIFDRHDWLVEKIGIDPR